MIVIQKETQKYRGKEQQREQICHSCKSSMYSVQLYGLLWGERLCWRLPAPRGAGGRRFTMGEKEYCPTTRTLS